MAGGEFDKDFGYLMPFLDKVAAAAGKLSDPAAREELEQLVVGERERWFQIRKLLSGTGEQESGGRGQGSDEPETIAENTVDVEQESEARGQESDEPETIAENAVDVEDEKPPVSSLSSEEVKPALQFTVGSLRPGKS
ncbi:MAG: hypothetical protein L0229_21280 [Blastocatellia bacterium]|nr:hypothetical protein [Blastocatellia bacterium]